MHISMDQFEGAWSAMSTPLTTDGRVDANAVEKLVEHQIKLGLKGLFIGGTAGEGPFLPDAERLRLIRLTVRFAANRLPIAFQITDNSAERMIENLNRYQDLGIDIAVIAPPFFQSDASQEFFFDLYSKVIEDCQIPVGIYNRGKYSSEYVEPETLGRILDNPKVVLVKDSAGQEDFKAAILAAKARRNGALAALCGDEFNCVPYLRDGYNGVLFGGGCFNGAYAVEIHRLVRAGQVEEAQNLQEHLDEVLFKVFGGKSLECWLAGQKELMVRLGVFNTARTLLNYKLTDSCSRAIDEVLRDEKKWLLR
ncbi:MAG: dihydrodipicolinate synthase family protein [Lentisphaeria bacterium]|nr:dihydrodipicolinate synthase family protein [Lentisphaeria bacterium]